MHKHIVAESGLIAHGRGEAFDYLLGEQTHHFALAAIEAAAAMIKLSTHPIISVNGNVSILCPKEMVEFSKLSEAKLEINLFYRRPERYEAIKSHLETFGADEILGIEEDAQVELDGLESYRRIVDKEGIYIADTVFVPLEDGDRTETLKRLNKNVITVDLNPLSRTSLNADITIVDNIIRVFPLLQNFYKDMEADSARDILSKYNNKAVLNQAMETMSTEWKKKLN